MSGAPAGAWAIDWAETETEGMPGLGFGELAAGSEWLWRGAALRMDASGGVMPLGEALGRAALRQRARRRAARLAGRPGRALPVDRLPMDLPADGFAVTDGRTLWYGQWVGPQGPAGQGPGMALFDGGLPPRGSALWVVAVRRRMPRPPQALTFPALLQGVVEGTPIATPTDWRRIETLVPGDKVLTRDGGVQIVRASTARHVSGLRMRLDPGLRAVRVGPGRAGQDGPRTEVLVSAAVRILVRGTGPQALFGCPEVLVAAADLDSAGTGRRVFRRAGLTYRALTLDPGPAGPHLISAAGLWCETFSPKMEQARRHCLSRGEAAILSARH